MPRTARKTTRVRGHLTPPDIATDLGIQNQKVIDFIMAGQLEAINLARPGCTRPRYHVSVEAYERFKESKRVVPEVKPIRRKRRSTALKDYFPDLD